LGHFRMAFRRSLATSLARKCLRPPQVKPWLGNISILLANAVNEGVSMTTHRRIVGNEAGFYSAHRLSPGVGAIRLFPEQNMLAKAFGWMRWWHWAGLALAALMLIDAKF
jgi:hypothetical protein